MPLFLELPMSFYDNGFVNWSESKNTFTDLQYFESLSNTPHQVDQSGDNAYFVSL